MANSKIFRVPLHGVAQIPQMQIADHSQAFVSIAKAFNSMADTSNARADKSAKIAGERAGALAASNGEFKRVDDGTIYGEAYTAAGQQIFQQQTATAARRRLLELETEFPADAKKFSDAAKGYIAGVVKEVEGVSPELAPLFRDQMEVRRMDAAQRIQSTQSTIMKGRAQGAALTGERAILEEMAHDGKGLIVTDPEQFTNHLMKVAAKRAELNAIYTSTGPDGLPLFSEKERVIAMQKFDDSAVESTMMSWFSGEVQRSVQGDQSADPATAYLNFIGGENPVFNTVDGRTGKLRRHELTIRDDLRKTIGSRMGSAISAANGIVTHAQGQSDRAIKLRNESVRRSILQTDNPLEAIGMFNQWKGSSWADPDEVEKGRKDLEYAFSDDGAVTVGVIYERAKEDILRGRISSTEQLREQYELGIGQREKTELVNLINETTKANFFTNSQPFKLAVDMMRSQLVPNAIPGQIEVNIGPPESRVAAKKFSRLYSQLLTEGWEAMKDGTLPENPSRPQDGEFDFVARASELLKTVDLKAEEARLKSAQDMLETRKEELKNAVTPLDRRNAEARLRAAENQLKAITDE